VATLEGNSGVPVSRSNETTSANFRREEGWKYLSSGEGYGLGKTIHSKSLQGGRWVKSRF
jgi:hypothetical protein